MLEERVGFPNVQVTLHLSRRDGRRLKVDAALDHLAQHTRDIRLLAQDLGTHPLQRRWLHLIDMREGLPGLLGSADAQEHPPLAEREQGFITEGIGITGILLRRLREEEKSRFQALQGLVAPHGRQ